MGVKENEIELIRLGNVYGEQFGASYAGNVWDKNGLCPVLMTMQGGGRQPMVIENQTVILKNMGSSDMDREPDATQTTTEATILARDYKGLGNYGSNGVIETVKIKQATKEGYIECKVGGVADLSYPSTIFLEEGGLITSSRSPQRIKRK